MGSNDPIVMLHKELFGVQHLSLNYCRIYADVLDQSVQSIHLHVVYTQYGSTCSLRAATPGAPVIMLSRSNFLSLECKIIIKEKAKDNRPSLKFMVTAHSKNR